MKLEHILSAVSKVLVKCEMHPPFTIIIIIIIIHTKITCTKQILGLIYSVCERLLIVLVVINLDSLFSLFS